MTALYLLVGHRGVGKTTLLKRMAMRCPEDAYYADLDHEIERRSGKRISELFAGGESQFRELETRVLCDLAAQAQENLRSTGLPTWVAAGAGLSERPDGAYVVWIRRETDGAGRIFLNRPRLLAVESPFQEYISLFPAREKRFAAWADETLTLPEGYEGGLEGFLVSRKDAHLPFEMTLSRNDVERWPKYWARREKWNLRRLELRDDLLFEAQIATVLRSVPFEQLLFSRRKDKTESIPDVPTDHALELGPATGTEIVSLHERKASLADTLQVFSFQSPRTIEKLAVEINNFSELREGHRWWLERPERRAFLPRSADGRWRWYRCLFGPRMPLHFIREGAGSAPDQPTLAQTLLQCHFHGAFAAVLGSPIGHSRSPLEHRDYFVEREMPFVAIDVNEHEINEAWPVLCEMGLTHAAVTAPLKKWAAQVAPVTGGGEVANTLWLEKGQWFAANTDRSALHELAGERGDWGEVWIWGAGAMSSNLQAAFPAARIVSARQGLAPNEVSGGPDTLIWATPRGREFKWPDFNLRPRLVLDLNYTDDSPGLEWAARTGVSYQSGLRLFKLQAEQQRRLWSGT